MSRARTTRGPEITDLAKGHDALLVLDVDEVVLEFIAPFSRLLELRGARLYADSFKLTGNVRFLSSGAALTSDELGEVMTALYDDQATLQPLVAGVRTSLSQISELCDIVFLTAMTPHHYDRRRALLDREGLSFPMIATERAKGAVVAELAARWSGPVIFVDDLPTNLFSVQKSLSRAHLIHLMANEPFRPHLPPLPRNAHAARDWPHAEAIVRAILGGSSRTPNADPDRS